MATALATISLTIYAFKTKTDISIFAGLSFVICLGMLPLAIISWFVWSKALNTIYCCLGLVLYSLYLIIDTMMICKGKSLGGYAIDFNDYIIGALMLYLDIVMMFVYLLRLLGRD